MRRVAEVICSKPGSTTTAVARVVRASAVSFGLATKAKVAFSFGVFLTLDTGLAIVDFYLMRRYARLDPPETGGGAEGAAPVPAPSY